MNLDRHKGEVVNFYIPTFGEKKMAENMTGLVETDAKTQWGSKAGCSQVWSPDVGL